MSISACLSGQLEIARDLFLREPPIAAGIATNERSSPRSVGDSRLSRVVRTNQNSQAMERKWERETGACSLARIPEFLLPFSPTAPFCRRL